MVHQVSPQYTLPLDMTRLIDGLCGINKGSTTFASAQDCPQHWVCVCTTLLLFLSQATSLGDHHRKQRKMLNPVFSINHMRRMIPIFDQVSRKVRALGT